MRQPIIFLVELAKHATITDIEHVSYELNEKHKHILDGFQLLFYVVGSNSNNNSMKCIYPTFVVTDELQKLQEENIKMLNVLLKDTIKKGDKEKVGILNKIFRSFKLSRILK